MNGHVTAESIFGLELRGRQQLPPVVHWRLGDGQVVQLRRGQLPVPRGHLRCLHQEGRGVLLNMLGRMRHGAKFCRETKKE
jgi:hypothetical protein